MRKKNLRITNDSEKIIEISRRYSVSITPTMMNLIDPKDPKDPIALQFRPDTKELVEHPEDLSDPIGDNRYSPIKGIVHRYPDRVLLTPINICPVYCRFCFRREKVGKTENAFLTEDQFSRAIDYIQKDQNIWEVILSGGDPLILSPKRLKKIIGALNSIEHVAVIRIHTRIPIVDPERISSDLVKSIKSKKAVYIVLHSNHPRELTASARLACSKLIDSGIPMLSQTVLLKGINDKPKTLEKLFRQLVANRIKPYYLHHMDKAPGTTHFRTSIKEGQEILKSLRGNISGLCQPNYVLDIPGGAGKVPIDPTWVKSNDNEFYELMDYQKKKHLYRDHHAKIESNKI
ncbi:MAG: lysine-2,3-aminomutase-like protein [Pseudomonadota bacterium]|nr:lysine-2,3-aminomutase-like protein [Pseudomonadota bacterium]